MPSIKQSLKSMPIQDQADLRPLLEAVLADLAALRATMVANKALYDAHTHEAPGSSYAASRTSTPDTGAAENSLAASAASAFGTPSALTLTD